MSRADEVKLVIQRQSLMSTPALEALLKGSVELRVKEDVEVLQRIVLGLADAAVYLAEQIDELEASR